MAERQPKKVLLKKDEHLNVVDMVVENLIDRKTSFKDKLMNFFGANEKSCMNNKYDDFEVMGDDFIISVLDVFRQ
ncbi:hypothetical protein Gotri_011119 [Gossypium trilobum]|uniref:Uncharacterized protein n=1 Tax=Gossypium trilobum TaxID=34281 RepID=A0A7J9ETM4_9ROSI|nr:hypothetical protein [Gossypium trilobum]